MDPTSNNNSVPQSLATDPNFGLVDRAPTPPPKPGRRIIITVLIVIAVLLFIGGAIYAAVTYSRNGKPAASPTPQPGISSNESKTLGDSPTAGPTILQVTQVIADQGSFDKLLAKALQVTTDVSLGGNLTVGGNGTLAGTITAANFSGNGANLTGVNATQLGGQPASYYATVAGLQGAVTGGLASANVALRSSPNTFSAANTFNAGLNASSIASGALNISGPASLTGTTTISSLILGAPLSVTNGGTGLATIPVSGVMFGQGAASVGVAVPSAAGQCLVSTATDVQFGSCVGGGAVSSLNSLTGAITLANASAAGSTITINDATTAAKGIASFNATNFSVVGGAVNTVQDLAVASTPTFAGITLTGALTVANGGTGTTSLAAGGVVVGQGTGALTAVTAGAAGQCLVSTVGAPVFAACPGAGGVTSLNGQSGTLTVANASAAAGTITINDATTAAKGIASFNSTNFTVTAGVVNTIQDISVTSSPTFGFTTVGRLNASTSAASSPLIFGNNTNVAATGNLLEVQLAGSSRLSVAPSGATTIAGNVGIGMAPTANALSVSGTIAATALTQNGNAVCDASGNCTSVTSLNAATGAVTIAGTSAGSVTTASGAITIADATALVKGLASFNTTNFTVTAGAVDTVQGISTTASPSFAGLTLATALAVSSGGTGTSSLAANGVIVGQGTGALTSVVAGAAGECLLSTAGAPVFGACPGTGAVTGGGTTNTVPKFTGAGSVGDSSITDSGTQVGVANPLLVQPAADSAAALQVKDASGSLNVLTVDTTNTRVGVGIVPVAATLQVVAPSGSILSLGDAAVSNRYEFLSDTGTGAFLSYHASVAGILAQGEFRLQSGSGSLVKFQEASTSNQIWLQAGTGTISSNDTTGTSSALVVRSGNSTTAGNTGTLTLASGAASSGNSGSVTVDAGSASGTAGTVTIAGNNASALSLGRAAAAFTLQGSAASTVAVSGGGFTTTLGFTNTPTGAVTYNFDRATAPGTYTVCTTAGNCTAGGAVTGSGTTNKLPKFTGASTVGDSNVADDGSLVTVSSPTLIKPGTNSASAFQVQNAAGTTTLIKADTVGNNVYLGTGTNLTLNGASAYISNSQNQSGSEVFGLGATVGGNTNATAIGAGASSYNTGVAVGTSAITGSSGAVAVGYEASAGFTSASVGYQATAYTEALALGVNTTANNQSVALGAYAWADISSIALGYGAHTSATHQLVIGGSTASSGYIYDAYLGSGITDTSPQDITVHATGGSGTDVAGANLTLAGGQGTGSASGGDVNFQIATPGASGAGANPLATVASLSGANGAAMFMNTADSALAFSVKQANGNNILTVDTQAGRTILGNASTDNGVLVFQNSANANTATLQSGATASSFVTTLPTAIGSTGQCLSVASVAGATQNLGYASCGGTVGVSLQGSTPGTADVGNFNVTGTGIAGAFKGGSLAVSNASAATTVISAQVTGDTNQRFTVGADGKLSWGSGSGATDTTLSRNGVNGLQSNSNLQVTGLSVSNSVSLPTGIKLFVQPNLAATIGAVIRANASQSANLAEFQDSSNNVNASFSALGNQLTLGRIAGTGAVTQGSIMFSDGTADGFGATLNTTTLTAGRTISLPNETGTVCLQASASCGFLTPAVGDASYVKLQNATPGTMQSGNINIDGTSIAGGFIGNSLTDPNAVVFEAQDNGNTNLSIQANGSLTGTTVSAQTVSAADQLLVGGSGMYSGLVVTASATQASGLLQLRDSNGQTNGSFDSQGSLLTLGYLGTSGTPNNGVIVLGDGSLNGYYSSLQTSTLTGSRSVVLPDESGTICLQTSTSCGFLSDTTGVQLQGATPGTAQTGNFNIDGTGIADRFIGADSSTPSDVKFQTTLNGITSSQITAGGDALFNGVSAAAFFTDSGNPSAALFTASLNSTPTIVLQADGTIFGQSLNIAADATIGGDASIQNASATAFQVANTSGINALAVDTINSKVILGSSNQTDGTVDFQNATNSNTVTLQTGAVSSSYTTVLQTAIGSAGQCLTVASVVSTTQTLGYGSCDSGANVTLSNLTGPTAINTSLTFASGTSRALTVATASSGNNGDQLTVSAGTGNGTNKNGGLLVLQGGGSTGSGTAGGVVVKNPNDSTSAFLVQNSAGSTTTFGVDTTNNQVSVAGNTIGATTFAFANAGTISTGTNQNLTISTGGTGVLSLDTGSGAQISIGDGNANTISIASNNTAHSIGIGTSYTATQHVAIGGRSTSSTIVLFGGAITTTSNDNGVIIGNGAGATGSIVPLILSGYNAYAETSGTCASNLNEGAMYYSSVNSSSTVSGTHAMRACVDGSWTDIATSSSLGLAAFGVMPDTGNNPGDMASTSGTQGLNGPCKVSAASATTIRIEPCSAYSGGRKVKVGANLSFTMPVMTSGWNHICLNGTNGSVASTNSATETGSLPTWDASNPVLCLADVKVNGTTITQVYDTRTFTTSQKEFVNTDSALGLGQVVVPGATTPSAVQKSPASALSSKVRGVVVATDGSSSSLTAKAIITTSGPVWVKAVGGTWSDYVETSATAGYADTVSSPSPAATSIFSILGLARTSYSGASCSATPTSANCQGSLYVNLTLR